MSDVWKLVIMADVAFTLLSVLSIAFGLDNVRAALRRKGIL